VDYLKTQFEEELNAEGKIEIRGQIYNRTEILSTNLRPGAYDLAFDEWSEDWTNRRLEEADGYLEQFDTQKRFAGLVRAFRTREMLPFVGAGMSIESGYPAWTPTLYLLCRSSSLEERELTQMLGKGEYEEAAQLLHDDLGPGLFNEKLEHIFGDDLEPRGIVNALPELFPRGTVITTNFDPLLEKVFATKTGFDEVETGSNLDEVLRVHAGGSRLLLKIHGHCTKVRSRVLLKSEYDKAYSDDSLVNGFFNDVMFGRSFVFLGCSLYTDRTLMAMANVVSNKGAGKLPRHYAIVELKDGDNQHERERKLAESNIFPIWYPHKQHSAVEALLIKLKVESED
jgi:hypothetical protein